MEMSFRGALSKPYQSVVYIILSISSFFISFIFIGIGFNRMLVYENPDSILGTRRNVHVGGDAYNFIINGTHATAYFVLGASLLLIGCLFMLFHFHLKSHHEIKQQNEMFIQSLGDNSQAIQSNVNSGNFNDLPSL